MAMLMVSTGDESFHSGASIGLCHPTTSSGCCMPEPLFHVRATSGPTGEQPGQIRRSSCGTNCLTAACAYHQPSTPNFRIEADLKDPALNNPKLSTCTAGWLGRAVDSLRGLIGLSPLSASGEGGPHSPACTGLLIQHHMCTMR